MIFKYLLNIIQKMSIDSYAKYYAKFMNKTCQNRDRSHFCPWTINNLVYRETFDKIRDYCYYVSFEGSHLCSTCQDNIKNITTGHSKLILFSVIEDQTTQIERLTEKVKELDDKIELLKNNS